MTPDREKNPGPEDAAVGLEPEGSSSTGEDKPVEGHETAQMEDDGSTATPVSGEQAPQAGPEPDEAQASGDRPGDSVRKAEFQEVSNSLDSDKTANLDLLLDVVVPVSVELGRTSLTVKDILSTYQGSVIELDRAAGEPVDILVGGKPLARGEVVVVKERFGVRVTELIGPIESVAKE
jgi:flagellar motor switch protein FliN/FliY